MEIRSFALGDEHAVVSLWQECNLTRPWNDPRKDIARKLTVQPELFLVAVADGRLIGTVMAGYDGHRGWVNYLAVAPAYRRRGYARALMERIEARLLEMGCPKLSLLVRTSNIESVAFYRHLGYAQDDAIALGKRLIHDLQRR